MKYFFLIVISLVPILGFSQGGLPESFFNGKSIVLVSADPGARPVMDWKAVADSVHMGLVEAGADPIAYYELEQVALSEEVQASYARAFSQRLVKNIIFVTRQRNGGSIHVGEFSGEGKLINTTALFGIQAESIEAAADQFAAMGQEKVTQNLLVIDVPEFPGNVVNEAAQEASANRFLPRNPLNLEMFKLGVPIEGSSAQTGLISYFRFDLYGKSAEAILAEQQAQKSQIENILKGNYPNEVAWLTEARSDEELIKDKVQFLLVKVEGREADLKRSMGVEADPSENRTVVKYYIRLIVRDELYIGPNWDADPDWRVSLKNFITNLKK